MTQNHPIILAGYDSNSGFYKFNVIGDVFFRIYYLTGSLSCLLPVGHDQCLWLHDDEVVAWWASGFDLDPGLLSSGLEYRDRDSDPGCWQPECVLSRRLSLY